MTYQGFVFWGIVWERMICTTLGFPQLCLNPSSPSGGNRDTHTHTKDCPDFPQELFSQPFPFMGMSPHLYPGAFALSDSNEIGSRLTEVFSKNIFLGGFRIF